MQNVNMEQLFRSVLEQDRSAIVICDINHVIVYMNRTAIERYEKRGGEKLIGRSLLDCHNKHSNEMIEKVVSWFKEDKSNNMIYTYHNPKENKDVYMVALRDNEGNLIGYYEKHEYRDKENAKMYNFSESLV